MIACINLYNIIFFVINQIVHRKATEIGCVTDPAFLTILKNADQFTVQ